ncbi:restriction endonuclease subunit S [Vibrio parahaemolyticus]|nr:restriction endonuclease subunit S [Vibrio parahaemolyticus]ELA7162289.1 restriction endonuclease subunit S [Vibrio parahaemolyticus]
MSFFDNHSNWPLVTLKDIATLKRGYDLPTKNRVEGDVPIYAANGINGSHNEVKIKGPGVITGRSGTIGKVHFTEQDYWPLNTSLYVTDFHGNDPKWVFYMLRAFQLERYVEGAGVPTLNRNLVHDELVPLPPLAEQKRIAAILDKADAIRQKRKQAIDLADEFLRSVFLDMFGDPVTNPKGWEERKLISGLSKVQSGWSANGESYPCTSNEFGVLKVSAVTSGYFKEYENKFVPREKIPEGKRLLFPKRGDLLFSRANTRELVAATCIVTRDHDNVFLPDKLWKIELNESLLPEFLHMLIQQPRFKDKLTSQATGSSGSMLNISKSKFEQTKAIFPSITEQIKFKEIYWKVTKSLTLIEASQAKSDDFFNSLSQKAFSGQL